MWVEDDSPSILYSVLVTLTGVKGERVVSHVQEGTMDGNQHSQPPGLLERSDCLTVAAVKYFTLSQS